MEFLHNKNVPVPANHHVLSKFHGVFPKYIVEELINVGCADYDMINMIHCVYVRGPRQEIQGISNYDLTFTSAGTTENNAVLFSRTVEVQPLLQILLCPFHLMYSRINTVNLFQMDFSDFSFATQISRLFGDRQSIFSNTLQQLPVALQEKYRYQCKKERWAYDVAPATYDIEGAHSLFSRYRQNVLRRKRLLTDGIGSELDANNSSDMDPTMDLEV